MIFKKIVFILLIIIPCYSIAQTTTVDFSLSHPDFLVSDETLEKMSEHMAAYLIHCAVEKGDLSYDWNQWIEERFELVFRTDINDPRFIAFLEVYLAEFHDFDVLPSKTFLKWFWIPVIGGMLDEIGRFKGTIERRELVSIAKAKLVRAKVFYDALRAGEMKALLLGDLPLDKENIKAQDLIQNSDIRLKVKQYIAGGKLNFGYYLRILVAEAVSVQEEPIISEEAYEIALSESKIAGMLREQGVPARFIEEQLAIIRMLDRGVYRNGRNSDIAFTKDFSERLRIHFSRKLGNPRFKSK